MYPIRMALVLPLLAGLVACAMPTAPGAPPSLAGTEWRLEELGGARALENVQATLAFPEAGRVAGFSSCNRFFGTYTLVQDKIAFGQMGTTRMACMGPAGEQENRYMAALQKAKRVVVEGNAMLLHVDGQDKPLRFARSKP
jgi:heat shock protein HslJ